jgi:hypothetical protein
MERQFWVIDSPDSVSLPHPDSIVGMDEGGKTPLLPIFDEEYGGVIAWANTSEQADRIVKALTKEGSQ